MTRPILAMGVAGAAIAGVFALLPGGEVRGAPPTTMRHQGGASRCVVTHTKTASPEVVLLGEEITITLGVRATCPDAPGPTHIVLVLDATGSMQGQPTQLMKQAATKLVRDLDMRNHPERRVGVVEFDMTARRLCALTNDEDQVVGCIDRVVADGGTRIDLGILEGLRVLSEGRGEAQGDMLWEVLIVLSDGGSGAGCAPILRAAGWAETYGAHITTVCLGSSCMRLCMFEVASSPRFQYYAQDPTELMTTFDAIGRQLLSTIPVRLTVTDSWGDQFSFVTDSAHPPPTAPDDPSDWLRWEEPAVPESGLTYTLRLRPLRAGYQAANETATGQLQGRMVDRLVSWQFTLPHVTVLEPGSLRTPPASPSPTTTPVAPTPPVTATRSYLPWVDG